MKTIIIYASKQGTSRACAEYLNRQFNNTCIYELGVDALPDIDTEDHLIIITGIYAGRIHKRMRTFLQQSKTMLTNRDLDVIVCAGSESEFKVVISKVLANITGVKYQTHYAGFRYNFAKLNVLERFIVKKIAGATDGEDHIKYENLNVVMEAKE